MRCVILNRNYPPMVGITGYSASELAAYLLEAGVEVHVVSTSGSYSGGGLSNSQFGQVHRVPGVYSGKNKFLRLFANLAEGFMMARRASQLQANLWICMTDPPLLYLWAARFAKHQGVKLIYWTMDLYPEAFAAAGLVGKRHFLYRWLAKRVACISPNYLITLGESQYKFILDSYRSRISAAFLPCGISQKASGALRPDWIDNSGRIVLGYVGNLGEAHSAEFVYEVIRALDPKRHCFVLGVYGSKAKWLISRVSNLPVVIFVDSVPVQQLQHIHVHLATLMPDWDHVCVPSKAVTAICQGGALLFHGTEENDNWKLLGECGWRIDPAGNLNTQVSEWIAAMDVDALAVRQMKAADIATKLAEMKQIAFDEILQFVKTEQRST